MGLCVPGVCGGVLGLYGFRVLLLQVCGGVFWGFRALEFIAAGVWGGVLGL